MPAPKKPNMGPAHAAAAAATRRRRLERNAAELQDEGWVVISPENADQFLADNAESLTAPSDSGAATA